MNVGLIAIYLVAGFVLLVVGAELLVGGAARVARACGISSLVVGLTVVAMGTSAPELVVSIKAGLAGQPDLALGNVVGSNIFNTLFILGGCALLAPLVVSRELVRREVPIVIVLSVVALAMSSDGVIGVIDGLILIAGLVIYTTWTIVESRRQSRPQEDKGADDAPKIKPRGLPWVLGAVWLLALDLVGLSLGWFDEIVAGCLGAGAVLFLLGSTIGRGPRSHAGDLTHQVAFIFTGLGALVLGADYLITGAVAIARSLHISELVIGLTIVAAGTSLPEVATSIIATLRNQRDIAIGNVVGSSIFNILGILGFAALATPGGVTVNPDVFNFDMPLMLAVSIACLPIFFTGFSIARWEGAVFLGGYISYTLFLVLKASQSPELRTFTTAMLWILPIVAASIVWTTVQAIWRSAREKAPSSPG